jgi:hypothetical protein
VASYARELTDLRRQLAGCTGAVIDLKTRRVTSFIPTGLTPDSVTLNTPGTSAYINDFHPGGLSVQPGNRADAP